MFSADTRNFIGIFMLVVGLTGMLIFAIWAISVAYNSFEQGVSSKQAKAYFDQGTRLYNEGKYEDAIDQFQNALRVSPKGPVSKAARASLASAYVNIGNRELQAGNIGGAASAAEQASANAPDSAAAHLFAGTIYSRRGDVQKAVEEWQQTIKLGEASGEAKTAREYLGGYYNQQAESYAASGQLEAAKKLWQKTIAECTGSDSAIYAQQRLDQSMGLGQ
jgi:tetratricopeptide (TPR) repeat protein